MKAKEILELAANGGVHHAFIGVHSVNIHHWKKGQIYSPLYEAIMNDTTDYNSVTLLSAAETGCVKHVVCT